MNLAHKSHDPATSHTSSSYQTKVTLDQLDVGGSFTVGEYLVVASAEYSCSATLRDSDDAIILDVDGVVVGGHNLKVLTAGDFLSFFAVKKVTITSGGAHSIRIRTRNSGIGEVVYCRNARILLFWNIQGLQYVEDDVITTLVGASGGATPTMTNSDKMALLDWEFPPLDALPLSPTIPFTQASKQHMIWNTSSVLAGASALAENLEKASLSFVPVAGPHLVLASWEQRSAAGTDASDLIENTTVLQRHDSSALYQAYFTAGAALARALQPQGVTYKIRHSNLGGGATAVRRARIAVVPCVDNTLMLGAVKTADPPPTTTQTAPGPVGVELTIGSPAMPVQGYVLAFVQAAPSVNAPTFDRIGARHSVDGGLVAEIVASQTALPIQASMPFASFYLTPLTLNVGKSTESDVSLYRVGSDGVARLEYLTLSMLTVFWASAFSTLTRVPERSWPVWLATVGVGD